MTTAVDSLKGKKRAQNIYRFLERPFVDHEKGQGTDRVTVPGQTRTPLAVNEVDT